MDIIMRMGERYLLLESVVLLRAVIRSISVLIMVERPCRILLLGVEDKILTEWQRLRCRERIHLIVLLLETICLSTRFALL